jgi:hypothetical protein
VIQSQTGQIVCETLSWKKKKTLYKKGWWSGLRCMPWVQTLTLQKKKKDGTLITFWKCLIWYKSQKHHYRYNFERCGHVRVE